VEQTAVSSLRRSGIGFLLVAAAITGIRCAAGRSWLPHSSPGVLSFAVSELFLVPLGLLLLMISLFWRSATSPSMLGATGDGERPVRAGVAALVMAASLALVFLRFPFAYVLLVLFSPLGALALVVLCGWGIFERRRARRATSSLNARGCRSAKVAVTGAVALILACALWSMILPASSDTASDLIRLAFLTLAGGTTWCLLVDRPTAQGSSSGKERARHAALWVLIAIAVICTFSLACAIFPVLSRKLEWGRYGYQPPVTLRSLIPITDKLGLRLPPGTRVVTGEFIAGPSEHLLAVLEAPSAEAETVFVKGQRFKWDIVASADELGLRMPPDMLRDLAGRSPVIYAQADEPRSTDLCAAVLDLSKGDRVVIYLYWIRTIEDSRW